ncbi:MAG TPA: hypothetical protein VN903_25325 [Polyangia bacterium]|nr:hypothetical protein [Polyangia bacterium]
MNRTRWRLLVPARLAGSIFLLLVLESSRAPADTAPDADTVFLLQPAAASPAFRRSLARIGDELSADRFHVVLADPETAGGPGALIESAMRTAEAGTALVLFGDPETGQAELCIVRHSGRRTAVRRATVVDDDPERMPEALARRALELLRATALELSIGIEPAPRPRPSEADLPPTVSPPAAPPVIITVDLGVATWTSIEGPPPAVAPVGRFAVRLSDWTWARITAAGLGTRPSLETAYGSATLAQSLALAEAVVVFRGDKRLRPFASIGAGTLNVAVSGVGAAPYEGRAPQRWSAAFDGGVGVALVLRSRAALVTELHGLVAAPHPVVRFVDTRAATIGYPSVLLSLALQVAP